MIVHLEVPVLALGRRRVDDKCLVLSQAPVTVVVADACNTSKTEREREGERER
jgi:hypothetical protein